jgi:3-phosphoshikimate 1-carboxyvinyltransferase
MATELAKLGIQLDVYENAVKINKGELKAPSVPLSSHNDHRIAMALSVLATLVGAEIDGAEAVAKSYPDFFEVLSTHGVICEEIK